MPSVITTMALATSLYYYYVPNKWRGILAILKVIDIGTGSITASSMARMVSAARKAIRPKLYEAQGGVCGYCGQKLHGGPSGFPIGHVFPHSRGMGNYRNVVLNHLGCEQIKGNRLPRGCEVVMLMAVNAILGYDKLLPDFLLRKISMRKYAMIEKTC